MKKKKVTKKKKVLKKTIRKIPRKRRLVKPKSLRGKIDIDQELIQGKQVFLFGVIDDKLAQEVVKRLITLDRISKSKASPITMWINSNGGSVLSGLSIIDTMTSLRVPVVTVIAGMAASMAGVISVCGYKRVITKNSIWMSHDMSGGVAGDYATKTIDRIEFIKWSQNKLFTLLRNRTKLSERELTKARHGELWLTAEECKEKGVVDIVV
jgi:ATP-dependent Clp protease protease subunit